MLTIYGDFSIELSKRNLWTFQDALCLISLSSLKRSNPYYVSSHNFARTEQILHTFPCYYNVYYYNYHWLIFNLYSFFWPFFWPLKCLSVFLPIHLPVCLIDFFVWKHAMICHIICILQTNFNSYFQKRLYIHTSVLKVKRALIAAASKSLGSVWYYINKDHTIVQLILLQTP